MAVVEEDDTEAKTPKMKKSSWLVALMIIAKSAKLLKVVKLLKFGKPLVTLLSLMISAIAYGFYLGSWWFAAILMLMLFVHEMGHVMALRERGFATNGPVFIPFLGAAIFAPANMDRDTEAYVGFGGPLIGTLAALGCFGLWFLTGQSYDILLLGSYVGLFLNVFNLIPISPLDGGRVTQAVGSWFKYVGIALLFVFSLLNTQPMLLLIWILVLDSFDRFPLWLRPVLSIALTLSMAILMVLGFSAQPWWVDILDCFMASMFTLVYLARDHSRMDKEFETIEERPYPEAGVRNKWLVAYLALSAVAILGIVLQAPYLPKAVHENSEKNMTHKED